MRKNRRAAMPPHDGAALLASTKYSSHIWIGEFLSLTEHTYRQYEANKVELPSSKAIKLADFFNVSIDYLLCRTNYWIDADNNMVIKDKPETSNQSNEEKP